MGGISIRLCWHACQSNSIKAFYGPTEYGGGGKIDPQDKTRFYYFGMEFELDWAQGTDRLIACHFPLSPGARPPAVKETAP